MKCTLLPCLFLLLGPHLRAQLAPHTTAPLAAHLLEVNAQWQTQDPTPDDGEAPWRFTSEAERIATHLHMVRERLLQRQQEGLSTSLRANRTWLLDRLAQYADDGVFPQNHVHPQRNPVFIDPHGTACAVGWLMIESGRRDLAERISADLNLAYLHEMRGTDHWPEIATWATDHGFTADELAWIQPGYPPNIPWAPLGGGTNGAVKVLLTLANGQVLVAGAFSEAGGDPTNGVALWNGDQFIALGDGISGNLTCATEYDGLLYVGGALINGMHDLAVWDGNSWSFDMVFESKLPFIHDLHVHDGVLHAAGTSMGFAGEEHRVMRNEGSVWDPLGTAFNGAVLALESFNGDLVAGGAFTQPVGSTDPLLFHVARYDGDDWHQLGDGLDATVRDLLNMNGVLHAAGDLFANIAVTFGLARINGTSDQWEHLLPNHGDYMSGGPGPIFINSLAAHNGMLYLAGNFDLFTLMVVGNHVAMFNGTLDGVEPLAALDQPVNAVAVADGRIIIGGDFNLWLPFLASTDITTGTGTRLEGSNFLVLAPSPATDITTVHLPEHLGMRANVEVLDAAGRSMPVRVERTPERLRLDVAELGAGMHVVRITTDGGVMTGRFVKE